MSGDGLKLRLLLPERIQIESESRIRQRKCTKTFVHIAQRCENILNRKIIEDLWKQFRGQNAQIISHLCRFSSSALMSIASRWTRMEQCSSCSRTASLLAAGEGVIEARDAYAGKCVHVLSSDRPMKPRHCN